MKQLYNNPLFQRVAGETLRPGGLTLTQRLFAAARLPAGSLILDLGCGMGGSARHLAERQGLRVAGLDRAWKHLLHARNQDRGALYIQAEMHSLPLRQGIFDAVLCECVLSVSPVMQELLGSVSSLLKPGGRLLLTDLYWRGNGRHASGLPGSAGCLTGAASRDALEHGLADAGLEMDVFEDHSRLLAELAARLVFAGADIREFLGRQDAGPTRPTRPTGSDRDGGCRPGPGYCLVMATRRKRV